MRWRTYLSMVASLALTVGVGCVGPQIVIERGEDLRLPPEWRTWDWSREVRSVINAPPDQAEVLHPQVVALVKRVLKERGFQRRHRRPDLLVHYRLEIIRERVITQETRPLQSISAGIAGSYHVSPMRVRESTFERTRLWLGVMSAHDPSVAWVGRFELRARDRFEPYLGQAVAQLLERLPKAAPPDPPLIPPYQPAQGTRMLAEHVGNPPER